MKKWMLILLLALATGCGDTVDYEEPTEEVYQPDPSLVEKVLAQDLATHGFGLDFELAEGMTGGVIVRCKTGCAQMSGFSVIDIDTDTQIFEARNWSQNTAVEEIIPPNAIRPGAYRVEFDLSATIYAEVVALVRE